MTGYVFTIAGGKGGVGKTTTAINAGAALREAGYDVVVVDADLAMANLGAMLGVDHEPTLHQVLADEAAVSDAIVDAPGDIAIVPGERTLDAFADADPANIRRVVNALSTAYEVVIVDTGAGLSHEATVPLGVADSVLIVTTADDVAVGDAVKTARLVERVDGDVAGVVLSRVEAGTDVEGTAEGLEFDLLGVVPEDEAAAGEEPLVTTHPDSAAAEAYRDLVGTLERVARGETENVGLDPADVSAADPDEGGEGGDEEEDSGGVFGLFK